MKSYHVDMLQLYTLFNEVIAHYDLPPENQAIAWSSAKRSQGRAFECYKAIARSLTWDRKKAAGQPRGG